MVEFNTEVITIIPPEIIENHLEIVIDMYIMYANGIPFFTSISRVIRFGSATEMPIVTM